MSIYSWFVLVVIQTKATPKLGSSLFSSMLLITCFFKASLNSFLQPPHFLWKQVSLRLEWIHIQFAKQGFFRGDAVDFLFSSHQEVHDVCATFSEADIVQWAWWWQPDCPRWNSPTSVQLVISSTDDCSSINCFNWGLQKQWLSNSIIPSAFTNFIKNNLPISTF